MALERLTQITEVGIQSGITLRNVNVEGAYVSGVVTATSLNITSGGANFTGVVTATSFVGNVTGNINPTSLNVSGVSTFNANVFFGDGDIAYFGDGQDLLIFHNSTDSIIRDNGTGDLFIEGGNRIKLTNPTGIETYAVFNQDGASELWYDNVKRLETSGIGVSITSALTVGTGASVSSPATNVLTLGTNNVERVRVDSSGNVGINSTSPRSKLDVGGELILGRQDSSQEGGQISLCRSSDNASTWSIDAYGSTSTPSIRFVDNIAGASRMEIDGSGRVKMPYQPSFMVHGSTFQVSNPEIFLGNSVDHNVGNHFSTTTGLFTAPISGRYLFSFSLSTEDTSSHFVNLAKNGSVYPYNMLNYGIAYQPGTNTQIMNLSANDTVSARRRASGYAVYYAWFAGCLIG